MLDNEFNKVKDEHSSIFANTTAANEHVGEVECCIQVKEQSWDILGTLPFKKLSHKFFHHVAQPFAHKIGHFKHFQPNGADIRDQTQCKIMLLSPFWGILSCT